MSLAERLLLGTFLVVLLDLAFSWLCFGSQLDFQDVATTDGVITLLGMLRKIYFEIGLGSLQRRSVQTKGLGSCKVTQINGKFYSFFFSFPLLRSIRINKWKVMALPGAIQCIESWAVWGVIIPAETCQQCSLVRRHHRRQQYFNSHCICHPTVGLGLLLFMYTSVVATLRQWAFTIVRVVITLIFKACPNHKSNTADFSWQETSFK